MYIGYISLGADINSHTESEPDGWTNQQTCCSFLSEFLLEPTLSQHAAASCPFHYRARLSQGQGLSADLHLPLEQVSGTHPFSLAYGWMNLTLEWADSSTGPRGGPPHTNGHVLDFEADRQRRRQTGSSS